MSDYEDAMELILGQLFNEFKRLTVWNAAYQHAIAIGGDTPELKQFAREYAQRDQQPLGIPKYTDLYQQAIDAVRHRDSVAFAELIPQVRARALAQKAIPEKE